MDELSLKDSIETDTFGKLQMRLQCEYGQGQHEQQEMAYPLQSIIHYSYLLPAPESTRVGSLIYRLCYGNILENELLLCEED